MFSNGGPEFSVIVGGALNAEDRHSGMTQRQFSRNTMLSPPKRKQNSHQTTVLAYRVKTLGKYTTAGKH